MGKLFVLFGNYMSRVGRKIIPIPTGVQVKVTDSGLSVKGPKGELSRDLNRIGVVVKADKDISVERGKASPAGWGLARALLANMVTGVEKGFSKTLEVCPCGT